MMAGFDTPLPYLDVQTPAIFFPLLSSAFVSELILDFAEVGACIAYESTDSVRCGEVACIREIMQAKCSNPAVRLYVGYDIRRRVRRDRVGIEQIGKHAASVGESARKCKSFLAPNLQIVTGR